MQRRTGSKEANQKLQVASDELKEWYTEIATLKSMKEKIERNERDLTKVESQCSGEMSALYEEGFAAYTGDDAYCPRA